MSILFICVPSSSLGRDTVMPQVAASIFFRFTPQIGANGCTQHLPRLFSLQKLTKTAADW